MWPSCGGGLRLGWGYQIINVVTFLVSLLNTVQTKLTVIRNNDHYLLCHEASFCTQA